MSMSIVCMQDAMMRGEAREEVGKVAARHGVASSLASLP
jgi:hypothetical protein